MDRPTSRAFTLIELLTVVAIISLLISILTPSLSRARAQAKATACGARLHDMATALLAYTSDFSGHLPVAEFDPNQQPNVKFGWAELLAEELYHRKPSCEPNESFPVQYNRNGIGSYYFYYFNCPMLGKEENHTGHYRVYLPAWSYGSLKRNAQRGITDQPDPRTSSTLETIPPQLPLLGDARTGVTGDPTSYIAGGEAAPGPQGRATFDDRHYGRANLLYGDGHVELAPFQPDRQTNLFNQLKCDWDLDGIVEPNIP